MEIKGKIVRRVGQIPKRFEYRGTRLDRKGFLSIFSFVVDGFKWRLDLMERGHACAILLADFAKREVVMIEQPRPVKAYAENPAAKRAMERAAKAGVGVEDPGSFTVDASEVTVLELCAGMVDPGETPAQCAVREVREETGYVIREDQLIEAATYYSTLGGSTELITAYIARLDADQAETEADGDGSEQIVVWRIPFEEAWRHMEGGRIRTVSSNVLLRELKIMDIEGRT
jgi:nudix-type nucleoside diphosphatase (YffH/AdpP family)